MRAAEVAAALQCSEQQVYDLVEIGQLESVRVGRKDGSAQQSRPRGLRITRLSVASMLWQSWRGKARREEWLSLVVATLGELPTAALRQIAETCAALVQSRRQAGRAVTEA
jgi:hypothetical protein